MRLQTINYSIDCLNIVDSTAQNNPEPVPVSETIIAAEPTIRLVVFLGTLAVMMLWEIAAPRRRRDIPRLTRWTNNLALVVLETFILRPSFPILAVGLAIYLQHVTFHAIPGLWWLHRMLVQPLRGPAGGHALDARNEPE